MPPEPAVKPMYAVQPCTPAVQPTCCAMLTVRFWNVRVLPPATASVTTTVRFVVARV